MPSFWCTLQQTSSGMPTCNSASSVSGDIYKFVNNLQNEIWNADSASRREQTWSKVSPSEIFFAKCITATLHCSSELHECSLTWQFFWHLADHSWRWNGMSRRTGEKFCWFQFLFFCLVRVGGCPVGMTNLNKQVIPSVEGNEMLVEIFTFSLSLCTLSWYFPKIYSLHQKVSWNQCCLSISKGIKLRYLKMKTLMGLEGKYTLDDEL